MRSEALDKAIQQAGGVSALALELGITRQAISQWDEVPPLQVLAVEKASGVPRHELRPDIFGAEAAPSQPDPPRHESAE
jgi:DNA-binding transcriptional regulator YdaS (Cro superfamily)